MPRDHNEFADTLIATSFWSLCLSVQCHRHFILDSSIVLALKDTIQNKNRRLFSRLLSIMLLRRALDSKSIVQDSYLLYMCLILQIIRSTMGYRGKLFAFSPSQSSHTILSVSHRCNFLVAKMHQKPAYQHPPNRLITNRIIII